MTIELDKDGNETWRFYRKCFRKARYKRAGRRQINYMLKYYPGSETLIIMY